MNDKPAVPLGNVKIIAITVVLTLIGTIAVVALFGLALSQISF